MAWKTEFDVNGNPYKVDTATGEVRQGAMRPIFEGDRIYTAEQQKTHRQYVDEQKRKAKRRKVSKECGDFYFLAGREEFQALAPQTTARLIYLVTYLGYVGNKLMLTQRTQMQRSDLVNVLGVSKRTADEFFSDVSPKYIQNTDTGLIVTEGSVFTRGKIDRSQPYYKMYVDGIRKVYRNVGKNQHRYLGYVFQVIPYVNTEYNVLCFNPRETNFDLVEPMTVDDFCDAIGFDKAHRCVLLKIYRQVTFRVGDHEEYFLRIVGDGVDAGKSTMFINPNILYSGSHFKEVKILGKFCKKVVR